MYDVKKCLNPSPRSGVRTDKSSVLLVIVVPVCLIVYDDSEGVEGDVVVFFSSSSSSIFTDVDSKKVEVEELEDDENVSASLSSSDESN